MLSQHMHNSRLRAFTRTRVARDHKHYRVQLVGAAVLFTLALLAVAVLSSAEASEWQGQKVSAGGVTHMKNPAEPVSTNINIHYSCDRPSVRKLPIVEDQIMVLKSLIPSILC